MTDPQATHTTEEPLLIAVSGASGNLGSSTVRHLVRRTDAGHVLALSRTPDRCADLGVRTRHADFDEADALVRALDGVERLLIVSIGTDERLPKHVRAIDAAVKAGVGHVVFTSLTRAGDPGHPNPLVPDYGATERLLVESGLPFTVLRFNVWAEMLNLVGVAPRAVATGVLPSNSRDGRIGHLTRDDSAAAAAAVLAEGGSRGEILEVTGPQAVTDADIAAALSEATGRPVRHEEVPDAAHPQRLMDQGFPEHFAHAWSAAGRAKRDGWYDMTTHAVQRLTGRPATPVVDYFAAHRAELIG
ncbi:NAD(P)H-binding protein [Streptomyces sp. LBUM 1478]|nr:NAD(P)H-binding protein [Streptomyces sp. LBUM 1485]MBP5910304.1 NAD(P)H-binding protein [Streptomyces sp. LBUM 1478]MBP5911998.1 NAD(P)H-binding protein [Streptomyces sp. LBUM 1486]MBP5934507.1 NAD(P)H-binding protein [Streptomyces sp. LBUM 1479]QTU58505.1 NAD(P)H-binding protein [Streptomyces sp. LBUM 1480]